MEWRWLKSSVRLSRMERFAKPLDEPAVLHHDVRLVGHLGRGRRGSRRRSSRRRARPPREDRRGGRSWRWGRRRSREAPLSGTPPEPPPEERNRRVSTRGNGRTPCSARHRLEQPGLGLLHHRGRGGAVQVRSTCKLSSSTKAMAPTVKSTTRATSSMTEVKVSSNCTRLRATRPISERIVAS